MGREEKRRGIGGENNVTTPPQERDYKVLVSKCQQFFVFHRLLKVMTPQAFGVLSQLFALYDPVKGNKVFKSVRAISRETGLSIATVERALKELVLLGLIDVVSGTEKEKAFKEREKVFAPKKQHKTRSYNEVSGYDLRNVSEVLSVIYLFRELLEAEDFERVIRHTLSYFSLLVRKVLAENNLTYSSLVSLSWDEIKGLRIVVSSVGMVWASVMFSFIEEEKGKGEAERVLREFALRYKQLMNNERVRRGLGFYILGDEVLNSVVKQVGEIYRTLDWYDRLYRELLGEGIYDQLKGSKEVVSNSELEEFLGVSNFAETCDITPDDVINDGGIATKKEVATETKTETKPAKTQPKTKTKSAKKTKSAPKKSTKSKSATKVKKETQKEVSQAVQTQTQTVHLTEEQRKFLYPMMVKAGVNNPEAYLKSLNGEDLKAYVVSLLESYSEGAVRDAYREISHLDLTVSDLIDVVRHLSEGVAVDEKLVKIVNKVRLYKRFAKGILSYAKNLPYGERVLKAEEELDSDLKVFLTYARKEGIIEGYSIADKEKLKKFMRAISRYLDTEGKGFLKEASAEFKKHLK